MDIREIDQSFAVRTKLNETDMVFHHILEEPIALHGVWYEDAHFVRMPKAVAQMVNPGVASLRENSAGGRIRFVTDSPYIAIQVKYYSTQPMDHFTLCGVAGLDLYAKEEGGFSYAGTFRPPVELKDYYESILCPNRGLCTYQINMPLYSTVEMVRIGIKDGCVLAPAEGYLHKKPIVFLGSSITQGGCASRPGMTYTEMLSRRLNFDYVNLGFSGSCRGEDAMMDYIASLDMSAFVYDYDHNTPSLEHLKQTHERGFLRVREKHPDLPIILLTAPTWQRNEYFAARRDVIYATYEKAKARGDNNVYFIDGETLFAICKKDGTVDGTHPNDLGFYSMAEAIAPVLEKIL